MKRGAMGLCLLAWAQAGAWAAHLVQVFPPQIISPHREGSSKKRPISDKATSLMKDITREIVERGGTPFSLRKGNHIVIAEQGFDVVEYFHLWPLSESNGSSKDKLITLTWKDDKGTLAYHGVKSDKQYDVVQTSEDGLIVVRDPKDPEKYRIALGEEPLELLKGVTGLPKDMNTAWFVPHEDGGMFIEKTTGKRLSVTDQPRELRDNFLAQVSPGRFVLLPKDGVFARMSDTFVDSAVRDRGASYEVSIAPDGDATPIHHRLIDKKNPLRQSRKFSEIEERDDFWVARDGDEQFFMSKDLTRHSSLFGWFGPPLSDGPYIRVPLDEIGGTAIVLKHDMSEIVSYRGTPQKLGGVLLVRDAVRKGAYFLMDPHQPEIHSPKFYGKPKDHGLMWEVTFEGKSFFISKARVTERSDSFTEGPEDFDGKLVVKRKEGSKIFSKTHALEASPWFKGDPEIANGSLLLRVEGNLQLIKRDSPGKRSIAFGKILKGVKGGLGRAWGGRRTFDKWLLVENMDGEQVWLSTEDHSVRAYEEGPLQASAR